MIYLCYYPKQNKKYNRSLAAAHMDIHSATHDVVAQCGAGGKPKLDLLRTHRDGPTQDDGLSWLIYLYYCP